jgi:hypothetical protein
LHLLNQRFDLCVGASAKLSDFSMSPFGALFELIRTLTFVELFFRSFRYGRQFREGSLDAIHIAIEFSAFLTSFAAAAAFSRSTLRAFDSLCGSFSRTEIFHALKFLIFHSSLSSLHVALFPNYRSFGELCRQARRGRLSV